MSKKSIILLRNAIYASASAAQRLSRIAIHKILFQHIAACYQKNVRHGIARFDILPAFVPSRIKQSGIKRALAELLYGQRSHALFWSL
jgi:hypothetical protein